MEKGLRERDGRVEKVMGFYMVQLCEPTSIG